MPDLIIEPNISISDIDIKKQLVDSGKISTSPQPSRSSYFTEKATSPFRTFKEDRLDTVKGYDEFSENPTFNPEFTDIQNQREYAGRQGNLEFASNLGNKFLRTTYDAVVEPIKQHSRNFDALIDFDKSQLSQVVDDSERKRIEEMYPTLGSGQIESFTGQRFIPFTNASGDFYGSMIPSLGYSAGTFIYSLGEAAAISALTGGAGEVLSLAGQTRRVGKAISLLGESFSNSQRAKNLLSAVGSDLLSRKGVNTLINMYTAYNVAASEASFEGANIENEARDKYIQDFINEKGYNPYGQDLKEINERAKNAKDATFVSNLPVLLASNFFQFGNSLRPFRTIDEGSVNVKLNYDRLTRQYSKANTSIFKNKALNSIWGGVTTSGKFLSSSLSEGFEEAAQSIISNSAKEYYSSLTNQKSILDVAFNTAKDLTGKKEFWDEFAGGVIGGGVFNVGMKGVEKIRNRNSPKKDTNLIENQIIEKLNDNTADEVVNNAINSIFNPNIVNLAVGVNVRNALNEYKKNDDLLAYNDSKDNSFREFLWNRASTGKFELGINALKMEKELSDEEFSEKYSLTPSKVNRERINKTIDALVERALLFEDDYLNTVKKFGNPYSVKTEPIKYHAFQNAMKYAAFSKDILRRDVERMDGIINNINTELGDGSFSVAAGYLLEKSRKERISTLTNLIEGISPTDDVTNQIPKLKKELDFLNSFDSNITNKDFESAANNIADYTDILSKGKDANELMSDIKDLVFISDRNKYNIRAFDALQSEKALLEFAKLHEESITNVIEKNSELEEKEAFIKPTSKYENVSEDEKLITLQQEGIDFLEDGNNLIVKYNGKDVVNTTVDKKQDYINHFYSIYLKSKKTNDETDTDELSATDRDKLDVKWGGKRKHIDVIPTTTSNESFFNANNEYSNLQDYFFSNLFSGSIKNIGGSLVTVIITANNVRAVEDKLGLKEGQLDYIIQQAGGKYNISPSNVYGHVTTIYPVKNKEGKYKLLDKDGNILKDFNDTQSIINPILPQGRLISLETDVNSSGTSKYQEEVTDKQKQEANTRNIILRESLSNVNDFKEYSFSVSRGVVDNKYKVLSKISDTEFKDYNTIVIGNKTNNLKEGFVYLEVDSTDTNGESISSYIRLNNAILTPQQKEFVKAAIRDTFEPTKRANAIDYLKNVIRITEKEPVSSKELQVTEQGVGFYGTGVLDLKDITEEVLNGYLENRYHIVNKSSLDGSFYNYEIGKKSNYNQYLLDSVLTTYTHRSSGENIPSFVQKYAIINFTELPIVQTAKPAVKKEQSIDEKITNQEELSKKKEMEREGLFFETTGNELIIKLNGVVKVTTTKDKESQYVNTFYNMMNQKKEETAPEEVVESFEEEDYFSESENIGEPPFENPNYESTTTEPLKDDKFKGTDRVEIDDDFQLNRQNAVDAEPITEGEIEDFKSILSKLKIEYTPTIERVLGRRKVWGAYKNAVATLYKGSNRNTLYHESFEFVYNSILTPSQQDSLIEEFRDRDGYFIDYNGNETKYSLATKKQAKEKIADDFLNFKNNNNISLNKEKKTIFQRILDFITRVYERFINPSINDVYTNILKGTYNNAQVKKAIEEHFQFGETTPEELSQINSSVTSYTFNSEYMQEDVLKTLLQIDSKNNSVPVKSLYDKIKQQLIAFYGEGDSMKNSPQLVSYVKKRAIQLINQGYTKEDATELVNKEKDLSIILMRNVISNWESYIPNHITYLTNMGINVEQENDKSEEKNNVDYIKDNFKFDDFKSIPASVKLIFSTLPVVSYMKKPGTNEFYVDDKGVPRVIELINPFTINSFAMGSNKAFFNNMISNLVNTTEPDQMAKKLEDLMTPSFNDNELTLGVKASTQLVLNNYFKKDTNDLSIEEMKIRLKLFSSFSKYKPEFIRHLQTENGSMITINEIIQGKSRIILRGALNKLIKNTLSNNNGIFNKRTLVVREVKEPLKNNATDEQINNALEYLGFDSVYLENHLDQKKPLITTINSQLVYIRDVKEIPQQNNIVFTLKNKFTEGYRRISDILSTIITDNATPQHLNVNGEAQYNIHDGNFITNQLSRIIQYNTIDAVKEDNPSYKDGYVTNSKLLPLLLKYKTTNNFSVFGGTSSLLNNYATSTVGRYTLPQLVMSRISNGVKGKDKYTNKKKDRYYSILENADSSTEPQFKYYEELDNVDLKDYLKDEILFIQDFKREGSQKSNDKELNTLYNNRKKGENLQLFSTILPISLQEDLYEEMDKSNFNSTKWVNENSKEIDKSISTYFTRVNDELQKFMEQESLIIPTQYGFDIPLLDADSRNYYFKGAEEISKETLNELLTDYTFGNFVTHTEMYKLFFGNPAYYKDPTKRFKSFISPALLTMHDTNGSYNKWMTKNLNNIEKNEAYYHEFSNDMKVISVKDIKTYSESLLKISKSYGENEATDAQSFMLDTHYRELMWKSGAKYSEEQELQYQIATSYGRVMIDKKYPGVFTYSANTKKKDLKLLKPYIKDGKYELPTIATTSIIKPIGRGLKTAGDEFIPQIIKTSSLPLTFQLVEGTLLEKVYVDMLKNNIGLLTFESAHKVGQSQSVDILTEDGNVELPVQNAFEIPYYTFNIQVETQGSKDTLVIGTQTLTLSTMDIMDKGVPVGFVGNIDDWNALSEEQKLKSSKYYSLMKQHDNSLINLFNDRYISFMDELGVSVEDDKLLIIEKDKTFSIIKEAVIKKDIPIYFLEQLNYKGDDDERISYELMQNYDFIKYMVYNMVDRQILSPKLSGGSKIQASSMLLQKEGFKVINKNGKRYIVDDTLKMYSKSDNRTTRMQIKMSSRMLTDVNRQRELKGIPPLSKEELLKHLKTKDGKKLLTGIGFRIPTQALSSIDAFEIVDFLPEYLGDMVIVPSELPTKAGSDFDVDKLSTYLYNYELDDNGFPIPVKSFNSRQEAYYYYNDKYEQELSQKYERSISNAEFKSNIVNIFLIRQALLDNNNVITEEKLKAALDKYKENTGGYDNYLMLRTRILPGMMARAEEEGISYIDFANKEFQKADKRRLKYVDMVESNYSFDKIIKKMITKSMENTYFDSLSDLILEPSRFEKLMQPNTVAPFTEKGGLLEFKNELVGESNLKDSNYEVLVNPLKLMTNRIDNTEGKVSVGIGAVAATSHSIAQRFLAVINPTGNEMFNDTSIPFKHNRVAINGISYPTVSSISKIDGLNIMDFISIYINGAVDVAKDPWMRKVGAYQSAFGVSIVGEKLGMNTKDIIRLINHPYVKQYMSDKALSKSPAFSSSKKLSELSNLYTPIQWFNYYVGNSQFVESNKQFTEVELNANSKNTSLRMLKLFMQFEIIAKDMKLGIDSSNHHTKHYNNDVITLVKDSKAEITKNPEYTIKVYNPISKKIDKSYSDAIRENTFIGPLIENIKNTEDFLFSNVFEKRGFELGEYLVQKMSKDDMKELREDDVQDLKKGVEKQMYTNILQEKYQDDYDTVFSLTSKEYKLLSEAITKYKNIDTLKKELSGLGLVDMLYLEIDENTNKWSLNLKNKPRASDNVGLNTLHRQLEKLKTSNDILQNELYDTLFKVSIMQNGTFTGLNTLVEVLPIEDYYNLSKNIDNKVFNPVTYYTAMTTYLQNNMENPIVKVLGEKQVSLYHMSHEMIYNETNKLLFKRYIPDINQDYTMVSTYVKGKIYHIPHNTLSGKGNSTVRMTSFKNNMYAKVGPNLVSRIATYTINGLEAGVYAVLPKLGNKYIKQGNKLSFNYDVILSELQQMQMNGKIENLKAVATISKSKRSIIPIQVKPETVQNDTEVNNSGIKNMSEITNHSGGAYGGDTYWDLIGREFGVTNHKHYKDIGNANLSQQLRNKGVKAEILTKEQMDFARQKVKELLGIEYKNDLKGNLQVRNFYQVYNADAVYAIAKINNDNKSVSGGTNTAIQLGIKLNKPVYVWDINTEQWYEWEISTLEKDGNEYQMFVPTRIPTLTKNFAGIGSRDIENYNVQKDGKWQPREEYIGKEKEEKAKQAIRDVYQNTLININKIIPEVAVDKEVSNSTVLSNLDMIKEFYNTLSNKEKKEVGNIIDYYNNIPFEMDVNEYLESVKCKLKK